MAKKAEYRRCTERTDMKRSDVRRYVTVFAVLTATLLGVRGAVAQHADDALVAARRFTQNPLVTVDMSVSLGNNVNGPTVIRVPEWIDHPLGRYYMYFANHMGAFIRLAYADAITGPWKIYEPGVLHVRDTALFRPQPDPPEALADFYTHVASPEILVDRDRRRLILWVHGWWTNGERWPANLADAWAWARQKGYAQATQVAESQDGLHFTVRPAITRTPYLRVFQYQGYSYGLSGGRLARATDPLASFEIGPDPFRDGPYATRVRHVALLRRGNRLDVFFTAVADSPEHVLMSTIDLSSDWTSWRASPPVDVLQPETAYECADLPSAPSERGDVEGRVRQIRDLFVFEEGRKTVLFYSVCGEQGIAAAEITVR
jgi:hypothetical protein